MDGPQAIIAVVVVAIAIVGGALAVSSASGGVGAEYNHTETFDTGAVGDRVYVDDSNISDADYSEHVDVRDSNGVTFTQDVDYAWNTTNGSLEVLSDDMANQNSAVIDYSYRVASSSQEDITTLIGNIFTAGAWLPFILVLVLVVLAIAAFGGLS